MNSHIYFPDVEHVIGNHDSNKSYVVITQTNQLIPGTKRFYDLQRIAPVNKKSVVYGKPFVAKFNLRYICSILSIKV